MYDTIENHQPPISIGGNNIVNLRLSNDIDLLMILKLLALTNYLGNHYVSYCTDDSK